MPVTAFASLPAGDLKRIALGGLEAIYHKRSGITHLLAEPVPDLLDALAGAGPGRYVTAADVLSLVAQRFEIMGDNPDEPLEVVIAERLMELAALGLVLCRCDA